MSEFGEGLLGNNQIRFQTWSICYSILKHAADFGSRAAGDRAWRKGGPRDGVRGILGISVVMQETGKAPDKLGL